MQKLTSKDGTTIAYDKHGNGPAVIVVWGALCTRNSWDAPKLPQLLSEFFTVYNYDRRGRGDSGGIQLDDVDRQREIEDIEALVDEAGGSAYVFGHSSGAALAMYAAVKLDGKIKKLVMYEPPFSDIPHDQPVWKEYTDNVMAALVSHEYEKAVALHMKQIGMPEEQIEAMRDTPVWASFVSNALSLAYDPRAVLGESREVPTQQVATLAMPALVMTGSLSSPATQATAHKLSRAMPRGAMSTLEGQGHEVKMEPLAPVLTEFFREPVS